MRIIRHNNTSSNWSVTVSKDVGKVLRTYAKKKYENIAFSETTQKGFYSLTVDLDALSTEEQTKTDSQMWDEMLKMEKRIENIEKMLGVN